MVAKDFQKTNGSTKAEVGEIDTSAPFQSVKDAVSLFGEVAFSGEKPTFKKAKQQSAELHLAQEELNKLSEQLKNVEETKLQALLELEKTKRTVDDLTKKLKSVNESKDSATIAGEVAKNQANKFAEANDENSNGTNECLNVDQETSAIQYMAAVKELDAAKQVLMKLRLYFDAFVEAKDIAPKKAGGAENSAKANSKEITNLVNSTQQVKLASKQAKEEETKICAEKDKQNLLYKGRLEESTELKKNIDLDLVKDLEPTAWITISRDELESLSRRIGESERLSEMKAEVAIAQVEAVKASQNEAINKLETIQKEIGAMKAETKAALTKAEMAEAAKKAVEDEFRRWCAEREQRNAIEKDRSFESLPRTNFRIQKQKPQGKVIARTGTADKVGTVHRKLAWPMSKDDMQKSRNGQEKVMEARKLEKANTWGAKKLVMPRLSSLFRKKKKEEEGGCPSFLPGEKPV